MEYANAFRAHWFVTMSGPLTVPFTIAAIVVDGAWQKTGLGILAAICGGYSSFAVWAREREARIAVEEELAAFLANKPRILGVRVADAKSRLPGFPEEEFELLVDIVIAEKTAFGDDWALDVAMPSRGVIAAGHRGRIAVHSCDIGRYTLTVSFPYSHAIPDREALCGGTITRLACVDAQHRVFQYPT